MRLVHLTSTDGQTIIAARIGYGEIVFSFFSTVSYYLEGPGNWGKKFPRLLIDLCDNGLIKNRDLDDLWSELQIIYKEFEKMFLSNVIYDIEDLSKHMPSDLLPAGNDNVEKLSQLWVTPRAGQIYLDTFKEAINNSKYFNGSLTLNYAPEEIFDKQLHIRPKNKGRKYWLDLIPPDIIYQRYPRLE